MATSAFPSNQLPGNPRASVRIPWTIWAGAAGVTSAIIGAAWDVSWHRSIGRDSFLTPAHILIYLCGILAAVVCGYLILYTTFGRDQRLRAESVQVLGFRGPLGAFIAAWGGIAMLTSAPFDNWWHAAYGLDVKIISPPHVLLMSGVLAISIGILFLTLAALNRSANTANNSFAGLTATQPAAKGLQRLVLYVGSLLVLENMFLLTEPTWDVSLHRASAYVAIAIFTPFIFAVFARATQARWACSTLAGIYTLFVITEILILPLFPASPKLGPVYNQVTHFIPAKFPILLLAPAIALDLFWQRARALKPWQLALISGGLFVAALVIFEWPFATFLMSRASENRFFGTIYFDYNSRPEGWDRMRRFFQPDSGTGLAEGLVLAAAVASGSTWIGLKFGTWMRGVQR